MKKLLISLFMAAASLVHAQTPGSYGLPGTPVTAASGLNRSVSVGITHQRLSDGFGNWNDQFMRLIWEQDRKNLFTAEVVHGNRFGESGVLGGASWTHVFDDDWFGSLSYARTTQGVFWPISQGTVQINRKWLAQRQLITTLGFAFDESRNNYSGRGTIASLSYYAPGNLLFSIGTRMNAVQPGDVRTNRGFGSITWGRSGSAYLSLTVNSGREGYQILNSTAVTNFSSSEKILAWKQWVGRDSGFEVKLLDYRNPFYGRSGLEAGLFFGF